MQLNCHTHPHVLRALTRLPIASPEKIAILERLEAKILECEITSVDACGIQYDSVLGHVPHKGVGQNTIVRKSIYARGK